MPPSKACAPLKHGFPIHEVKMNKYTLRFNCGAFEEEFQLHGGIKAIRLASVCLGFALSIHLLYSTILLFWAMDWRNLLFCAVQCGLCFIIATGLFFFKFHRSFCLSTWVLSGAFILQLSSLILSEVLDTENTSTMPAAHFVGYRYSRSVSVFILALPVTGAVFFPFALVSQTLVVLIYTITYAINMHSNSAQLFDLQFLIGELPLYCYASYRYEKHLRAEYHMDQKLAHALAVKSQFIANMSHEMLTPLNGIMGSLQLFNENELAVDQLENLKIIFKSSEDLHALINNILDLERSLTKKVPLEFQEFDLRTSIEKVAKRFFVMALQKGIELSIIIESDVPKTLIGDQNRLRQILMNYLSNAVKFTSSGDISVLVSVVTPDRNGPMVLKVEVRDTGCGVAPFRRGHLFLPFVQGDFSNTRAYGGSGLGLAICHELSKSMAGEVGYEAIGKGSSFFALLPFVVRHPTSFDRFRTIMSDILTDPSPTEGPERRSSDNIAPMATAIICPSPEMYRSVAVRLKLFQKPCQHFFNTTSFDKASQISRFDLVLVDVQKLFCRVAQPSLQSCPFEQPGSPLRYMFDMNEARNFVQRCQAVEQRTVAIVSTHSTALIEACRTCGFDTELFKPIETDAISKLLAKAGLPVPGTYRRHSHAGFVPQVPFQLEGHRPIDVHGMGAHAIDDSCRLSRKLITYSKEALPFAIVSDALHVPDTPLPGSQTEPEVGPLIPPPQRFLAVETRGLEPTVNGSTLALHTSPKQQIVSTFFSQTQSRASSRIFQSCVPGVRPPSVMIGVSAIELQEKQQVNEHVEHKAEEHRRQDTENCSQNADMEEARIPTDVCGLTCTEDAERSRGRSKLLSSTSIPAFPLEGSRRKSRRVAPCDDQDYEHADAMHAETPRDAIEQPLVAAVTGRSTILMTGTQSAGISSLCRTRKVASLTSFHVPSTTFRSTSLNLKTFSGCTNQKILPHSATCKLPVNHPLNMLNDKTVLKLPAGERAAHGQLSFGHARSQAQDSEEASDQRGPYSLDASLHPSYLPGSTCSSRIFERLPRSQSQLGQLVLEAGYLSLQCTSNTPVPTTSRHVSVASHSSLAHLPIATLPSPNVVVTTPPSSLMPSGMSFAPPATAPLTALSNPPPFSSDSQSQRVVPDRLSGHPAPDDDAVKTGTSSARDRSPRSVSSINVLCADDQPINQTLMDRVLKKVGCRYKIVSNGAEAVEAKAAEDFDVILMDCQMPVCDGYEATRRIRLGEEQNSTSRRSFICAVTANVSEADRLKCLASGMDDHMPKPIKIDQIRNIVLQAASRNSSQADGSIRFDHV